MHIAAHLGIDLVALDVTEDVTCLVELTAPNAETASARPGQTLVLVLDRSGSMAGEPLEGAKAAIRALLQRLAPQDRFGLVVFDDSADVVVPVKEIRQHDLPAVLAKINRIRSGGSTDLSAGYLLGLREAKRELQHVTQVGATVLLVSDGHANAGVVDPVQVGELAAKANSGYRVTTSTLGFGLGYDEALLDALARGGNGTHVFAPDVDAATHALQDSVSDLLEKSVVAALMRVRPARGLVDTVTIMQQLPHWAEQNEVVVNVGDLYAGETRKLLFGLHVPAISQIGTETIAEVVFEYTAMPDLDEHKVSVPISVNIVPGDQARGRIPNPVVEVERLLAQIDLRKQAAISSLRAHDQQSATAEITSALTEVKAVRDQIAQTEPRLLDRIDETRVELEELEQVVKFQDANYSSKRMTDSFNHSSRGRRKRPPMPDHNDESEQ